MKNYTPLPLELDDINLPKEIMGLLEMIAENVHEVWAFDKMKEGWIYGKQTDSTKKTHSNLVPYNQLSEADKDYDRKTALNSLKIIYKLGYKIEKE